MQKVCLILIWLTAVASSAESAETARLRIGTYVPEQSVGVRDVIRPWMKAVKDDAGDRVIFEEYWGGSLGRDPFSQYDLVRHGVLDIAWVLPSYTPGVFPQIHLAELPNLARNAREASLAAWAVHEVGLLDGTGNIHVIGIWTTDITNIHSSRSITELKDIRNLRIRTAGSVQADFISVLDAAPQTIDSVETNEALQRGTVDGLIQGWTGMRSFRTELLAKSVYTVPSGAIPFLLLMNLKSWEKLDPEIQSIFSEHGGRTMAANAGSAYDTMALTYLKENVEARSYSIFPPTPEDQEVINERTLKMHEEWQTETPNGKEAFRVFTDMLRSLREDD